MSRFEWSSAAAGLVLLLSVGVARADLIIQNRGGGITTLQYIYTPHPVVPVPEHASGILLAIGIGCLAAARRRAHCT